MNKAIIIEDLSVLTNITELQRRAYNQAFMECGVPWEWDVSIYASMQYIYSGVERIRYFHEINGGLAVHSADFIYAIKNSFLERLLERNQLQLKTGIEELISLALSHQHPIMLATIEPEVIIQKVLQAAGLSLSCFDCFHSKSACHLEDSFLHQDNLERKFSQNIDEVLLVHNRRECALGGLFDMQLETKTILFDKAQAKSEKFTMLSSMNDMMTNKQTSYSR